VAFGSYLRSLSTFTQAYLATTWRALPDMSEDTAWQWAAGVVPVMERTQGLVAGATDSYVSLATGEPAMGLAAEDFTTEKLRGVPGAEVWTRPPREVWWQLSKGALLAVALKRGLERAQDLAATNLQLAHTHAFQAVATVTWYRRQTRPGGCELCVLATRHPQRSAELMAIHGHCHCVAVPMTKGAKVPAPGPAHQATLAQAEAQDVEVAVHDHQEIGPVLARAGDHFSGPARVSSTARITEQTKAVEAAMTNP